MKNRLLVITLVVGSLSSCVSTKELVLFQDGTAGTDSTALAAKYVPTIQPNDVLAIQVSSLNPEATSFFNPYTVINAAGQTTGTLNQFTQPLPYTTGYLVSDDGTVELPLVGKIVVKNLSNAQAANQIREKLTTYLKEPTVNVRNQNFRISVLGEVNRPSIFTVPNERITLPEALGLAGDLTIYGQRKNVLVIREENGKRAYTRLDLTKRSVFQSPYYYLHNNDVIYVEPSKSRLVAADRTYQLAPIVISALSFLAIIITQLRR